MTSFAAAQRMTTAGQTEAPRVIRSQKFPSANDLYRTMADVCEAFWCILCVLWLQIRVHSCPFAVPNEQLSKDQESMENACGILETFSKTFLQ